MKLSLKFRLAERILRKILAGGTFLLLAGVPAGVPRGAVAEGTGPDAGRTGVRLREILLGGTGEVLVCPACPKEPPLRVDVESGLSTEVSLPYQQVSQIAPSPDGKRVLVATFPEKGRRSLLLVLSSESLSPLGRVEIPGNGERIAVSPDGYTAYLICSREGREGPEERPGKRQLVVVDLGASEVKETYPLSGTARDLALSPAGDRLFVAMEDRVQSFTTAPLTASWYYRSPGENRRIFVRPRRGEIYALRGTSLAVFNPEPKMAQGGPSGERADDAAWLLDPPIHLERMGFSPDGRLAVGAGMGIDIMVVLDAGKRRSVGTWPENGPAITSLLENLAAAGKPRGPRGRLTGVTPGFTPPLQSPPKPTPPAAPGSELPAPAGEPSRSAGAGAGTVSRPGAQGPSGTPPEAPGGEAAAPPSAVPSAPGGSASAPGGGSTSPAAAGAPEEVFVLEEVAEPVLSGRILGERSLVVSVLLFGPDSLTTLSDQATPSPDGTYSFNLPPRGRYRIVPVGDTRTALSVRPAFQTVLVGQYGFRGLDFQVLGAVGGGERSRGRN